VLKIFKNGPKNVKNQPFLKIFGQKNQILPSTDLLGGLFGEELELTIEQKRSQIAEILEEALKKRIERDRRNTAAAAAAAAAEEGTTTQQEKGKNNSVANDLEKDASGSQEVVPATAHGGEPLSLSEKEQNDDEEENNSSSSSSSSEKRKEIKSAVNLKHLLEARDLDMRISTTNYYEQDNETEKPSLVVGKSTTTGPNSTTEDEEAANQKACNTIFL